MKKIYLLGAALMALAWTSCTQDDSLNLVGEDNSVFTGDLEQVSSRTILGDDNKIKWVENDELTIFKKNNLNRKYKVAGVNGGSATFDYISYIAPATGTSNLTGSNNYAVYPYSDANAISVDGIISAPIKANYQYESRSSFISSALMASTSTGTNFSFKNVQGYLRLRLCAVIPEDLAAVESITLTSATKNLSGTAEITWIDGIPSATITDAEAGKTLTVTLATSQSLPSNESGEYVELYLPVLPMEFPAEDVELKVTFTDGTTYAKKNRSEFIINRGEVTGMKLTVSDDETFTGEIEEDVIIKVESSEDFAEIDGKGGIANLYGDIEGSEDITFTGALQADGEVTLDMNDNTLTSGTPAHYGLIATGSEADVTIDNTNLSSKGGGVAAVNGANVTFNSGSLEINTTSTSGRYLFYLAGEGSTITINGGNFDFNKTQNQKRAYIYADAGTTAYVKGGTFGKASTRSGYTAGILGSGTVIITGGTFGFNPTAWVADGYKAVKNGSNWYVVPEDVDFDNVESAGTSDELNTAVGTSNTLVNLAAGEYTFPGSKIAEGVTIVCEPGTVFTGNSKLNINGSTVIGATFSNPSGSAVDQTINGTFKNCTFTGSNALRWTYAGETVVFEDCIFDGSVYGIHFDGGANDVIFRNCTISGFNGLGAALTMVTFEGCTFKGNGKSGYNGANLWGSAKMIDCEFTFDGSTANEWIDCIGADKSYEFQNCTVNGVAYTPSNYVDYNGVIFSRNNVKVTINGTECQM